MNIKMVKFYQLVPRMTKYDVVLDLYINDYTGEIEGGAVTPYGEQLLNLLQEEPINVNDTELSFDDGELYLENLYLYYNSPYLYASQYKKQTPEVEISE